MPSALGKLGETAATYAIFMELEEMLGFISLKNLPDPIL